MMDQELIRSARQHAYELNEGVNVVEGPEGEKLDVEVTAAINKLPPERRLQFELNVQQLAREAQVQPFVACSALVNFMLNNTLNNLGL